MSSRIIPVVPGLLISMRTSIKGGVHYRREDLADEVVGEGTRSEWKTEKQVDNAEEYTQARRLRGRIVTLIGGACVKTAFTYICPLDREATLNDRIAEAQAACDAFNSEAVYSRVSFDLMRGRYTEDTHETIQAVRREIQELMGEMSTALGEGKVEGIRDVAARATNMGRLLEEGSEARTVLERAVKESRRVARQIVKRVEEGADAVAEVLAGANVSLIATARHTFAEEETGEITDGVPSMPSTALGRFGDLGQDYVEPPAPEPAPDAPPPSPGIEAGAALDALSGEDADSQEEAEEPGVGVPLSNAAQILANPGATGTINGLATLAAAVAHQGQNPHLTPAESLAAVVREEAVAGDSDGVVSEPATEAEVVPGPDDFDDDALGEI